MNNKQGFGFTLTELIVTVAIVGIIASIAVPSFARMVERYRLKEVAEGLKSDLMWMRTETIKRSCNLKVAIDKDAWSYTIFRTAGTCDCPVGGGNCNDKVVNGSEFTGVSMSSASAPLFDFRRGTAFTGNAILDSTNYHVKVVVAPTGRVRICNISGSTGLPGYDCD